MTMINLNTSTLAANNQALEDYELAYRQLTAAANVATTTTSTFPGTITGGGYFGPASVPYPPPAPSTWTPMFSEEFEPKVTLKDLNDLRAQVLELMELCETMAQTINDLRSSK